MLRDASLYYAEDFVWMGPLAFNFYIDAVYDYLSSDDSLGDAELISALSGVFRTRLERDRDSIDSAKIARIVELVLDDFDRYQADPDIFGDLRNAYRELRAQLSR